MRKRLFAALLLLASALMIAVAVTTGAAAFGPGGATGSASDTGLSFKPFDVGQLMHFQMEVDAATSGKRLDDPRLNQIEERMSRIRGLPLKEQVPFIEASETVVRFQMMEEFDEEMSEEELKADERLLVELGLFPKGKSLERVLLDVYTEQIAGSYDTEDKVITIVGGKGTSGAMDDLTISHEVVHALQDQNFGLDRAPLDNEEYNGDQNLAITSLIEGDATLAMVEYGREYLTPRQLQELGGEEVDSDQLDKAPAYVRKSILFPYEEGFTFARALAPGGDQALDRALADPPMSSEQILHPEKYVSDRDDPRPVPLADISGALGEGWSKTNEDCMGEFDVNAWFEEHIKPNGRKSVGEGWGGNTIQLYEGPGGKAVIVNSFVWDTPKDAGEFYRGYRDLLEKRFRKTREVGSGDNAFLLEADGGLYYCAMAGDATLALQAPDAATLDAVLKNFPGYPAIRRTACRSSANSMAAATLSIFSALSAVSRSSSAAFGTVWISSRLTTHPAGMPSALPSVTSVGIERTVRVTGATVTQVLTS